MFSVPPRSGGTDLIITITKSSASKVVLNHIAVGATTDFTAVSQSGQTVTSDYGSGYPRIPMVLPRKIRTVINSQGAPTATLTKIISLKVKLDLKNIPVTFASKNLVLYQKFWVENGFFIQNDNDTNQSYMAFNFMPAPPRTHSSTRELVNLSYSFQTYNGQ
jgi:hypothetical protein